MMDAKGAPSPDFFLQSSGYRQPPLDLAHEHDCSNRHHGFPSGSPEVEARCLKASAEATKGTFLLCKYRTSSRAMDQNAEFEEAVLLL